jgi:7-carboxy-7-deazaguanine synthase
MIVNEIFYSLQGEGSLAGVPSVFIRLAGCPLRCRWCDTKYAWQASAGQEMSGEQVAEKIASYPTRHIVITGGEPMTHPGLKDLLETLADKRRHITIETSGIKHIDDLPCDLMSISPKLSNSVPVEDAAAAEHDKMRFDGEELGKLIDSYRYQLKFVVDGPEDLDEIAGCLKKLENVNPDKVFLMPQATTSAELLTKSKMLARVCRQTGFALSQRLQVMLWENEKGR